MLGANLFQRLEPSLLGSIEQINQNVRLSLSLPEGYLQSFCSKIQLSCRPGWGKCLLRLNHSALITSDKNQVQETTGFLKSEAGESEFYHSICSKSVLLIE